MRVNASFKTEQAVLDELRNRHVNISELVHTLLMDWLSGEKPSLERLKEECEQAEKDALIAKSRADYLKKQLEKQLTIIEAEQAERHKKEKTCVLCDTELGRNKEKLQSGPHAGRFVCGTAASGCATMVLNNPSKKPWFWPAPKVQA